MSADTLRALADHVLEQAAEQAAALRAIADRLEQPVAAAETITMAPPLESAEAEQSVEMIEVPVAAARFAVRQDTIRSWLRADAALGQKCGGRWLVSLPRLRVRAAESAAASARRG